MRILVSAGSTRAEKPGRKGPVDDVEVRPQGRTKIIKKLFCFTPDAFRAADLLSAK